MKVSLRSLIVVALVPAIAGLLQFGDFSREAQLQEVGTVIQPDVLEALETSPEVGVIIHLTSVSLPPPGELGPATLYEYKRQVAAVQDRVLAKLSPADFTLTVRYSVSAALAGRITESGVEKLRGHPDVNIVSINGGVFLGPIEPLPTPPGDANCDGEVTSIDALLVLQFDAGLLDSLACQDAADVNEDGSINSLDAALILQIDAGLSCLPDPLGMPIVC